MSAHQPPAEMIAGHRLLLTRPTPCLLDLVASASHSSSRRISSINISTSTYATRAASFSPAAAAAAAAAAASRMQRPGSSASRTLHRRFSSQHFSISIRRFSQGSPRSACDDGKAHDGNRHDNRQKQQQQQQNQQQNSKQKRKQSFRSRLGAALGKTKIEWYPIPVGLGIGFLGLVQFFRAKKAEERRQERERQQLEDGEHVEVVPRPRVRPTGPWHVQVISLLPLKALSRAWGWFNELTLPYHIRVPCFKLYAWIFGVNLDEIEEKDLHVYPNLAAFFYRKLDPTARPLDPNPLAVLSPADGRVSSYGMITNGEVEQVKGMTYNLDALLGREAVTDTVMPVVPTRRPLHHSEVEESEDSSKVVGADEEFAKMYGISYNFPALLTGTDRSPKDEQEVTDASMPSKHSSETEVKSALSKAVAWYKPHPKSDSALYYVVIYLAPGDYHRFHSPVPWVVEGRRHFAGELYSVSPYLQRNLPGLFTLNERIALLGRWRWGFFSMTPVGATNVGSIKINFDAELRTNSVLSDKAADRAAALAAKRGEEYHGFSEATYRHASQALAGHALQRGEEMGGFQLGSTIVLVFEAPKGKGDGSGWNWKISKEQRVKVGEALGEVRS